MKKSYYYIILTILGLNQLNVKHLFAQSKFKLGEIITLAGDTISGNILEASSSSFFEEIKFKSIQDNEYKTYKPNDIKGYIIDKKEYFITQSIKIEEKNQEKFLKVAVAGELSLYYYKRKGDLRIFVKKEEELIQIEKNRFFNLLNLAFGDCEKMNLRNDTPIEKLRKKYKYNLESLSENTVEYNDCKAPLFKSKVYYVPEKLVFNFGIKAGIKYADVQFLSDNSYWYHTNFSAKTSFFASGFLNIAFNRKISLQAEILLNRQKSAKEIPFSATNNIKRSYTYTQGAFQFPLLLQYTFSSGKNIRPYINGGIGYKSVFSEKIIVSSTYASSTGQSTNTSENNLGASYGTSFLIGTGVYFRIKQKNKILLDLRYDLSINNINSPNRDRNRQDALMISTGFIF